jgi:hypothetical protein
MWHFLAPRLTAKTGFLEAKRLKFGSDDETIKSHQQGMVWTKTGHWVDSDDGFDYAKACEQVNWPPTWFIAAIKDKALGHPADIKRFMAEAHYQEAKYTLLAKKHGFERDYDHINMLTEKVAVSDHFEQIAQWMKSPVI